MENIVYGRFIKCFNGGMYEPQIEANVKIDIETGEVFIPPFIPEDEEDMHYLWQELIIMPDGSGTEPLFFGDKCFIETESNKEELNEMLLDENKILTLSFSWNDIIDAMGEEQVKRFKSLNLSLQKIIIWKLTNSFANGLSEGLSWAASVSLRTLATSDDIEEEILKMEK